MKRQSTLWGLAILLATLFRLNAGEPPPVTKLPDEPRGRYTMFTAPAANGGVPELYVIDSQSGRIWRRTLFNGVSGIYLVPVPYLSADQAAASATPNANEILETRSLQKQYNDAIESAKQIQRKMLSEKPQASGPPAP